jgi:hypothetical protein
MGKEDATSFLRDVFLVKFPGNKNFPTTGTEIKTYYIP